MRYCALKSEEAVAQLVTLCGDVYENPKPVGVLTFAPNLCIIETLYLRCAMIVCGYQDSYSLLCKIVLALFAAQIRMNLDFKWMLLILLSYSGMLLSQIFFFPTILLDSLLAWSEQRQLK